MSDETDHAGGCERQVGGGEDRGLPHLVSEPSSRKGDRCPDRVVREVETDSGGQRAGLVELGLHQLRRPQCEEGGGEVADAEDGDRRHQSPETRRHRHAKRNRFGAVPPRVACDEREQHHAQDPGYQSDQKDGPESAADRQQEKGDRRPDERAGGIKRLVKTECLPEVFLFDGARKHRGADWLAQPATHPGQGPGDDHLRPTGDSDEKAEPEDRDAVTADRHALPPRNAIAVPTAPELDQRRRAVADAFDHADRERRCTEARRDEQRQHRKDHLVVGVGGQVGDADPDDVAVEPPDAGAGRSAAGRGQTTSRCSGWNGPPSASATNALASTGLPFSTETITYT